MMKLIFVLLTFGILGCVGPAKVTESVSDEAAMNARFEEPNEISESVLKAIRPTLAPIRRCYEAEAATSPNLRGKALVRFNLKPTGEVKLAYIEKSTLGNKNVEECILQNIRAIKSGPLKPGESDHVLLPMSFSPEMKK